MQGKAGKTSLGSLGDLLSQVKLGGGTGYGETSFVICFSNYPGDLELDVMRRSQSRAACRPFSPVITHAGELSLGQGISA